MKALVVFYSWTGNTKKVALRLKKMLECDIEEIIDTEKRKGLPGMLGAALGSILNRKTVLCKMKKDPSSYDIVIIGSPIWAGRISVPVRTYISLYSDRFSDIAFFCTCGNPLKKKLDEQIEGLFVKKPVAVLKLKDDDVRSGEYVHKLDKFAGRLTG